MKIFTTNDCINYSKKLFFIGISLYFLLLTTAVNAQIYINEFQASNKSIVPEMYDFSDFPDWIELYNSGSSTAFLDGYSLSDDMNEPLKYVFPPSATIPAHGFFRIWTDNHDAAPGEHHDRPWEWANAGFTTKYYHAPFKLSKAGEEIALFDDTGELLDYIEFSAQVPDASYGRKPDGSDNWVFFGDPTPGVSNTTTSYNNTSISASPEISPSGGFFEGNTTVTISSPTPGAVLRYTTDGSLPDENAPVYSAPLTINEGTSLRVRAYDPGKLPSFSEMNPFIYDDKDFEIPIITLTTDDSYLWDTDYGIYTNELKQRNIPVKMEYFTDKDHKVLSTYGTLKLSGQLSYTYPQKPFTITAKSKFGADYLEYPFFANIDNNQYKSIYLRNSGWPDIHETFFRDALSHTIVYNQMNIDAQSYQPAATYLNGEFWGIYNIREKLSNNYFEYHHNVDPKNIDLLEYDDYSNGSEIIVNEGDSENFDALQNYMSANDLSIPQNYEYIKTQIDVDEYINYMIAEIFVDNNNWQHCNVKWWRERKEGAKWRWILLDTDLAFGAVANSSHNLLEETLESGWSHFLFRQFNKNKTFKDEFIQRFAAYMNTTFKESRTVAMVDSLQNNIAAAIPFHRAKWNTLGNWEDRVASMRTFASTRPPHQREHLIEQYDITDTIDMDITISGGEGKIYAHDVWLPEDCLSGKYFAAIPIRLKAVPVAGYKFVEWEGISTDKTIIFTRDNDFAIHAIFAPTDECIIPSKIESDYTVDNSCDYYIALGDITIEPDATLTIEEGVEIRMPKSANIYVKGKLLINGTAENPVVIQPNEKVEAGIWGGLCFDNATDESVVNHLQLITATKGDNDKFLGAISADHSDIVLNNVSVDNVKKPFYSEYGNIVINDCDFHSPYTCDMINIKYASSALVENCDIGGNDAVDTDAIDFDGVSNGIIRGNTIHGFNGYNSDGIDLGEGCDNLLVENNLIYNLNDKAVSVGQGSTCTLKRNVIIGCSQGVGIKDFGSYAYIDQNTFYGNEYGVACFEKNVGHGGGAADIVNTIFSSSAISSHFVDDLSTISINYSLSDTDTIPGEGNLSTDPLFVDELVLNLELQDDSPCIDTGDPTSPFDPDNSRADMGAYYTYTGNTTNSYEIVFNEINYNSQAGDYNSGDWVELYNYGETDVDISDWIFTDNDFTHKYIIDKGTVLHAGEFLVIVRDAALFENVYGTDINYIGEFGFGLGNGGDAVRLLDADFKIVDVVAYDDDAPWSSCADGKGSSLMLLDVYADNTLPESWSQLCSYPTPGIDNYICTVHYDYQVINGCSGHVQFINRSTGIYDSATWYFDNGHTSNLINPQQYFDQALTFSVQLVIHANEEILSVTKPVEIETIYSAPIVTDGHNCGTGVVALSTTSSQNTFWYENETGGEVIGVGNTFTTPSLDETTTYFVANGVAFCTSLRVPIIAQIREPVVADFDYTTNELAVTFENKSTNGDIYLWNFGDGVYSNQSSDFVTHNYAELGTYSIWLLAKDEDGICQQKTGKEIEVGITSVNSITDSRSISVYPNPFTDQINIYFQQNDTNVNIEIFDVTGKSVVKRYLENVQKDTVEKIDLSGIPIGSYMVKITTDGLSMVKNIVK